MDVAHQESQPETQSHRIAGALREAEQRLKEAHIPAPRLTAEVLLSHVLGQEKAFLYAHPEYELPSDALKALLEAIERRCNGVPTQYITGIQEFYGLSFKVTPDVLIPRPETEHLVEQALVRASSGDRILDVGAGSGCIAISVKKNLPQAFVCGCETSGRALRVAVENARQLDAAVEFVQADLVEAFTAESLGLIVCNPPYVPLRDLPGLQRELRHEPAQALFGGEDGLGFYRRLAGPAARVLRRGGWLLMELGYNVRFSVAEMFATSDWAPAQICADLAGIDRVLAIRKM